MALTAGKLAPSLAVTAFMGYCVWPSVSDIVSPPPPPPTAEKIAELAPSLFNPKLPPPPQKNPFGGLSAGALAEAKAAGRFAGQTTKMQGPAIKKAMKAFNPVAELRLEATSILGNDKLAVINGNFYAPGQRIPTPTGTGNGCTVADVLPNKVLLAYQGKTVTLTYSNTAAASSAKKAKADAPQTKKAGE
jgi:hypothetical protein